MNSHSDTSDTTGEGVWAPDIEKAFLEALELFPPCGRRKHILQEEGGGKMYGRNELIAKYIKDRTGCERTRKQVSSHIQVLARRKARTDTGRSGGEDSEGAGSSSPASGMSVGTYASSRGPHSHQFSHNDSLSQNSLVAQPKQLMANPYFDVWFDRPIATKTIRLVEFSAYFEYRKQQHRTSNMPLTSTNASLHHQSPAMTLAGLAPGASPQSDGPVPMDGVTPSYPYMAAAAVVAAAELSQPTQSSPHLLSNNQHPISGHNYFGHQTHDAYNSHTNGISQLQQPLNSHQHQQQMNQRIDQAADYMNLASNGLNPFSINYPQQPSSAGITRHSYVKIDYRQHACRQLNKLEHIDLHEFQDKFPEMLGSGGLYQRGSPDAFYLVKFWADMNVDQEYSLIEDQNSNFNFSCSFETLEPFKYITCSTKACSYGAQVVEKVDKIYGALNSSNGKYSYIIDKSPMCEFMIDFIKKLRQLPRMTQMNSVLENFSVLQVVTSESSSEVLLCLGFVFEISSEQHKGSQYRVYKLTKH